MALDAADWTVSVTGDIRWTGAGTGTNVTVLEMHRFLQDLADDAVAVASTLDLLAITNDTPSDRATDNIITLINGYNIDDTAAQHIFDGSIEQDGGDTFYRGLVVVGAVESGTEIQIEQNGAKLTSYWGALGAAAGNGDTAANILLRIMVKTRADGASIDGERIRVYARELGDTYAEFSVTMGAGNNTAALFTGSDLNNDTAAGTIATYTAFGNTEGFRQITIGGTAYDFLDEWTIAQTGSVPDPAAINDLYEYTKWLTRRGSTSTIHAFAGANQAELYRGITSQWNYDAEGGTGPATNEDFSWGAFLQVGTITGGPFTVGEKVTGGTSGAVGRVLSQDATDTSLVVATESGTWNAAELITGTTSGATATTNAAIVGQATGGGRARLLAIDDNGTTGTVWVQLLVGTTPADNAVMYESTDHTNVMTVNGSVTARTLSQPFLGASTGSALIGAFGVGIASADLTNNDLVFDLTNAPINPPNLVTWTISGLVSGEDRVLVAESTGAASTDIDEAQDTISGSLTGAAVTSVVVTTAIPTDTPSSGTIRIEADDGRYLRVPYDSYSGSTYTIPAFDFDNSGDNNCTTGNNVYISYIDELATGTTASFSSVYLTDRNLAVRVRDGGGSPIKTFETPSTLNDTGGSASAIRTSDA